MTGDGMKFVQRAYLDNVNDGEEMDWTDLKAAIDDFAAPHLEKFPDAKILVSASVSYGDEAEINVSVVSPQTPQEAAEEAARDELRKKESEEDEFRRYQYLKAKFEGKIAIGNMKVIE